MLTHSQTEGVIGFPLVYFQSQARGSGKNKGEREEDKFIAAVVVLLGKTLVVVLLVGVGASERKRMGGQEKALYASLE